MIKGYLERGELQVELRCERAALFDLNKKHSDLGKIFYGESINLQIIFNHDLDLISELKDNLHVLLDRVSIEKVSSLAYSKLGASIMKIKSMESLNGSSSPLASHMTSMDCLPIPTATITTLHEDASTLVLNMPIAIPELLEEEGEDDLEGSSSASKQVLISVSIFERTKNSLKLDDLLEKTEGFGNGPLRKLIRDSAPRNEEGLEVLCKLRKSVTLVNPLNAMLTLQRISDTKTIMNTRISPTEHLEHLTIEDFQVSATCNHGAQLLDQYLRIVPYPGVLVEFPIELRWKDSFAFAHQMQVFNEEKVRELSGLRIHSVLTGEHEGHPLRLELEMPFDLSSVLPSEDVENSSLFRLKCKPFSRAFGVNSSFTLELIVHNASEQDRNVSLSFPIPEGSSNIICMDPESTIGLLKAGSSHSVFAKFVAMREGLHKLDFLQLLDQTDGSLIELTSFPEIFVACPIDTI